MNLADNLKKIRKEHNLSQEQLAETLGVSRQAVSKWESNQAYPEMDKMLQLCQMFNLNIDDLLNQDIKEINNTKQAKNNINKYIDDFLDYITKTIDMFSSMKFKEKIKCLFEQCIIIGIISLILLIIGSIFSSIFSNLFSFMPYDIYYPIFHIFEAIYIIICLILGIILILHIFKIRYLDYYVIIKDEVEEKTDNNIEKEEPKKIVLEKKQEKVIIRDPKHSGYKFISGLLRCFLIFIKFVTAFIALSFCLSLITFIVCLIISFLFIKTGLMFVGVLLSILACIIANLIILNILYNFIISKKVIKSKLSISFITSLIMLGVGIGFISIGITKFDIVDDVNSKYFIQEEKAIEMKDDLFFNNDSSKIEYIESENDNIKVVIRHSKFYTIEIYPHSDGYYIHNTLSNANLMSNVRENIKDINDKKIIDYSEYRIYIYTTKENIEVLKNNLNEYYQKQNEI